MAKNPLLLPEVLSNIFAHLSHNSLTLSVCSRVNQTWFFEAVRLLWQRCGVLVGGGPCESLGIRHLAALSSDHKRQQLYASFIECLWFSTEYDYYDHRLAYRTPDVEEARIHETFKDKELRLSSSRVRKLDYQFLKLQQYFQPRLNCIRLYRGVLTPDLLLFAKVSQYRSLLLQTVRGSQAAWPGVDTMVEGPSLGGRL